MNKGFKPIEDFIDGTKGNLNFLGILVTRSIEIFITLALWAAVIGIVGILVYLAGVIFGGLL